MDFSCKLLSDGQHVRVDGQRRVEVVGGTRPVIQAFADGVRFILAVDVPVRAQGPGTGITGRWPSCRCRAAMGGADHKSARARPCS